MTNKVGNNLKKKLFGLYKDYPLSTKLYVRQRWIPFRLCEKLESYLPNSGKILDLGCGYGIFAFLLALKSQKRKISGIDCIEKRVRIATEIGLQEFPGQVEFKSADILSVDISKEDFDAISLIDVLCYIPFKIQQRLLKKCWGGLKKNGVLLIKDFDRKPLWKFWLFYTSDYPVNIFRILFAGPDWRKAFRGRLFVRDPTSLSEILRRTGYDTKITPLGKGNYEPHILYLARKI